MKQLYQFYKHRIDDYLEELSDCLLPPEEGYKPETYKVLSIGLVKNTRGYIEKISNQINGCYEKGWYDACSVMIRRLLETLIIEVYEEYNISDRIKDNNENYYYLKDLINSIITEKEWTLGRNVKNSLPKLKEIGDKSAHSRRYNAHRSDIDKIKDDFRDIVQELLYLSRIK